MSHIFISYHHDNTDYVKQLTAHIQANQFSVWWDEHIKMGSDWREALSIAIQTSSTVVVIMAQTDEPSKWVKREIELALEKGIPIIPLLLAGKAFSILDSIQHIRIKSEAMPGADFFERLREHARPNSSYMIDALVKRLEDEKGFEKQAHSDYLSQIEPAYIGIRKQSWSFDINAICLILADSLSPSQMKSVHDDYFSYLRNWKPSFFGERLIKKRGILGFVFEDSISQETIEMVRQLVRDSEQSGLHILDGVRTVSWAISLDLERVEGQSVMLEILPPAIANFYPGRQWVESFISVFLAEYTKAREVFKKGI